MAGYNHSDYAHVNNPAILAQWQRPVPDAAVYCEAAADVQAEFDRLGHVATPLEFEAAVNAAVERWQDEASMTRSERRAGCQ